MITWTWDEFEEFRWLVELSGSRDNLDRIRSRIGMSRFIEQVGREKCDAMWAEIQKEEE